MCCKGGCPHPHYVFSLALDVWSQAIDVVDINCWNWPIKGYTRSWHIRMRYWKHWWQAPLSHLSPASTWFSCIFFRCTFPTILEPGTGLNSLRPNWYGCIPCAYDKPTTHIVACTLQQPQVVCRFDLYNSCHSIIVSTLHASKLYCTIGLKSLKTLSKLGCNKSHRFWLWQPFCTT